MNKISKIGLSIFLLNFILMTTLLLLNQTIPNFIMYVFSGSIMVTIARGIINPRVVMSKVSRIGLSILLLDLILKTEQNHL